MPQITQVGRVMVPVSDQDEAISFYTEKLGFSLAACGFRCGASACKGFVEGPRPSILARNGVDRDSGGAHSSSISVYTRSEPDKEESDA